MDVYLRALYVFMLYRAGFAIGRSKDSYFRKLILFWNRAKDFIRKVEKERRNGNWGFCPQVRE
jgi:hypothetical protein